MKTIKILDREYSVNVEEIDLSFTEIKDISALKECKKLKKLDLYNTKVKDISALKECKKLEWLSLRGTEIKENDLTVELLRERGVSVMFCQL